MLALKLAFRNIMGAGLRTWLNVIVLSFSFVVIIWHKGLLDGWDQQAKRDMIKWEMAGGQYWQQQYDPYDPFSLTDAHGKIPQKLNSFISKKEITPILISQGTLYPQGRMQSILVKGISPEQTVLELPSSLLKSENEEIPAIIGTAMSKSTRLNVGDYVTLRWRDKNGTFDATEIRISGIFDTNVPTVEVGQVWIPLDRLQEMMLLPDEATILVRNEISNEIPNIEGWNFKSQKELLADLDEILKSKTLAGMVIWAILLMLAMLAIFDTQVLSIFRRQKEIGTYVALGMTRKQVVALFTIEGAMHSVLAAMVGAVYGYPLLAMQARNGITMPIESEDYGMTFANTLYPVYSLGLVFSTVIIVLVVTIIVSYWPSRKIAKMNPTDALRGRAQ